MPQRNHRISKFLLRLVFLALLGWAFALVRAVRPSAGWDEWADAGGEWTPRPLPPDDESEDSAAARVRGTRRRLATSLAFATLFFAGAAFTAGAGDMVAKAFDPAKCAALMQATGEDESVCAELLNQAPAPEALPAEEPAAEAAAPAEAPAAEPSEAAPSPEAAPGEEPAASGSEPQTPAAEAAEPAEAQPEAAAAEAQPDTDAAAQPAGAAEADDSEYLLAPEPAHAKPKGPRTRHWVVRRANERKAEELPVEAEGGQPTIWLNRALPDPTPPAKRLTPAFAKKLQRISAVNGVSWALVLGVLRAEGARDRVPATVRELNSLARGLRVRGAADSEWNAVLSLSGRSSFADRAVALARYNRTVGLRSLVDGLEASKQRLVDALLADTRVQIYGPGRDDLKADRIDVRVVVMIQYLAETYGQVSVTSLFSGHRKYARPGVVSAHIFGHAVDIASVGGTTIVGHQQPGGITEKAVRSILLLPVEVQPRQVISLLGLGGPSFPLADHGDHIHVGY